MVPERNPLNSLGLMNHAMNDRQTFKTLRKDDMTKMYRAVPRTDLHETNVIKRLTTSRVPVNVPYLVDNIWESLRPAHAPSRRHAVFASPSAEQAMASASKSNDNAVCEVIIRDDDCRIVHLPVPDAKEHQDIKTVMRAASSLFSTLFNEMGVAEKNVYASLFMPCTSAQQTAELLKRPELKALLDAANACTIWTEAKYEVIPGHPGELFFELSESGKAELVNVEDALSG